MSTGFSVSWPMFLRQTVNRSLLLFGNPFDGCIKYFGLLAYEHTHIFWNLWPNFENKILSIYNYILIIGCLLSMQKSIVLFLSLQNAMNNLVSTWVVQCNLNNLFLFCGWSCVQMQYYAPLQSVVNCFIAWNHQLCLKAIGHFKLHQMHYIRILSASEHFVTDT